MVAIIWRLRVVVVAHAARAEFSLTNMTFEAALAMKSLPRFHELASQVQEEMKRTLNENADLDDVTIRVDEFQ